MLGVEDCSTRTLKPLLFLDRYLVGTPNTGLQLQKAGSLGLLRDPKYKAISARACMPAFRRQDIRQ